MKADLLWVSCARIFCLAGLMVLPLQAGCGNSSSLPPDPLYFLLVTSVENPQGYEKDPAVITVGGGEVGGSVGIFINGKLVDSLTMGGTLQSVNQWLHPGANVITLSGAHDVPLYIKVYQVREDYYSKTGLMDEILKYYVFPVAEKAVTLEIEIPPP